MSRYLTYVTLEIMLRNRNHISKITGVSSMTCQVNFHDVMIWKHMSQDQGPRFQQISSMTSIKVSNRRLISIAACLLIFK